MTADLHFSIAVIVLNFIVEIWGFFLYYTYVLQPNSYSVNRMMRQEKKPQQPNQLLVSSIHLLRSET